MTSLYCGRPIRPPSGSSGRAIAHGRNLRAIARRGWAIGRGRRGSAVHAPGILCVGNGTSPTAIHCGIRHYKTPFLLGSGRCIEEPRNFSCFHLHGKGRPALLVKLSLQHKSLPSHTGGWPGGRGYQAGRRAGNKPTVFIDFRPGQLERQRIGHQICVRITHILRKNSCYKSSI